MCVESLSVGLAGSCEAVKKAGGVYKSIFAGSVKDIDTITYDATTGEVTAIAMKSTKQMVEFKGRLKKNSADDLAQSEGEGNVVQYEHQVMPVLFYDGQAEVNAIEELFSLDQAFFIIPMRDGKFKVYGISKEDHPFVDFGLSLAEGANPTGIELNDQNAQTATMSGMLLNKPLYYNESATFAANLTAVEALTTPAL